MEKESLINSIKLLLEEYDNNLIKKYEKYDQYKETHDYIEKIPFVSKLIK